MVDASIALFVRFGDQPRDPRTPVYAILRPCKLFAEPHPASWLTRSAVQVGVFPVNELGSGSKLVADEF